MQRLCVIAFVGCYRTSFNRLELYPLILIAPNVGNSLDEIVSHLELNTLTELLDKEINTKSFIFLYMLRCEIFSKKGKKKTICGNHV